MVKDHVDGMELWYMYYKKVADCVQQQHLYIMMGIRDLVGLKNGLTLLFQTFCIDLTNSAQNHG